MLSSLHIRVSLPILILIAVVLAVAPISTAHAVTITWTTTGSDPVPTTAFLADNNNLGNTKTFTSGAYQLKAAGFSTATATSALTKSYLAAYGGGLGVSNNLPGYNVAATSESTSPGHATDNVQAYDMVIFAFPSEKWDPISTHLNTFGNAYDTDLTFLVGGKFGALGDATNPFSGFAGLTLADLTNPSNSALYGDWFQHDSTAGTGSRVASLIPNNSSEAGRYLIIAAQITSYDRDDYFKIDSLAAAPVPEPSTFLLLGSGLAGLAAWRRRKKSKVH